VRFSIAALLIGCGSGANGLEAEEPGEEPEPAPIAVALRLEDAGTGEEEIPLTRALLVLIDPDAGRTTHELGEFQGICSARPASDREFYVGASCWWQGAELEIGVVESEETLVAYARGAEGERVLARIELPERSHVYPVGADEPSLPATP
jgi:hypothetical protein